jgi:hypothetical protein
MSYGVLNLLKALEVEKVQEIINEPKTYAHFFNVTLVIKLYPFVSSFILLLFR